MNILLTNDDGIDAPGLEALRLIAQAFGSPLIVAPLVERSGCSHSATTDRAIRVTELAPDRIAVDGTPADCVRIALHRHPGQIGWVFAGINNGGNLGTDVYLSGTVAAVREAAMRGIPGIAISNHRYRTLADADWRRATRLAQPIIAGIMERTWRQGTFWNINLPCLEDDVVQPDVVYCPLDSSPLPLSFHEENGTYRYNAKYRERARIPGSDVDVCFAGRIAVTQLRVVGV